tara:strand:- start:1005 stop:5798 length:4794 start_codon:yes stop_codon:yes gene_type:complete
VNFLMLPIRRPVAVSMFFVGVMLLGAIAWQRLPVELFPALEGDRLFVQFNRPGSDPEVIEREILLPLQARVSALADVSETFGEIRGSSGSYEVSLEAGADFKVRKLELQRIVVDLQREQPLGTWMYVSSSGTGVFSSFVMMLHIIGPTDDKSALHDLVEQIVAPRFASVPGVSQALVSGGAGRQVTVRVDPGRATALGLSPDAVPRAVEKNVGRLRYLGNLENEEGRLSVMLDGRPPSLAALSKVRIQQDRPVLLRHVADVEHDIGLQQRLLRVNGQPAVGLVIFQEQGANLVRLGRELRGRVADVREELSNQGVDLVIGFDAAESVEEQITRLSGLGATGFAIALAVLFFFLRQWRAVAVVGLAVPISLLAALSLLYLVGQSLNLVTLFGLALAVGLVVDNSVVVFEAVQRHLERGVPIDEAVHEGLRRTVRAILAASATTAVVFLPLILVDFDDEMIRELSKVVTISILLPLAASLLIAVGLVPLLAHHLAAPAAQSRLAESRGRRAERAGMLPPDQVRILFTGIVANALRHPPAWISGTIGAVVITAVVAVPWVGVNSSSREAAEADTVRLSARFPNGRGAIEISSRAMGRLEQVVLDLPGVESVETLIQEDGGSLTVQLVDEELRPPGFNAQTVRNLVRKQALKIKGLEVLRPGEESRGGGGEGGGGGKGGGRAFGGGADEIVLSGPDSALLETLAGNVEAQLKSMPQVTQAWTSIRPGLDEMWVEPILRMFEALGLTFDQVLPVLRLAGREGQRMQTGFVMQSGRELPIVVERRNARLPGVGSRELTRMRVQTPAGVLPITALASMRQMPAPQVIAHHNGRREIAVMYRLHGSVPDTGPSRLAVEEQITAAVRSVPRPPGTTIETVDPDENTSLLQEILVPAVALLFLVLAMTFESLSLPVLVLLTLPLTLLGATWALAFAGMPLGQMAILGALTLVGLTVNSGILLVDRMQQFVRESDWSPGAAALAAVRERTRPVLMTTATTVAGLWPLSIATGRENEIWPPFATIVIGGLITSSLLTLLIMPVGFILLRRLDDLFNRVGPWLVLAWLGSTVALMAALILSDAVTSLFWKCALSLLTGGVLLGLAVLIFRPRELPQPDCSQGPPTLEVRHLQKVYGLPGSLRLALLAPKAFAARVLERGGRAFHVGDARDRLMPLMLGVGAMAYVTVQVQSSFWTLIFALVAAAFFSRFIVDLRRARGRADEVGTVDPGGVENWIAGASPWIVIVAFTWIAAIAPFAEGRVGRAVFVLPVLAVVLLATLQAMRRSARRQASGELSAKVVSGSFRILQNMWRQWAARVGGLDLPANPTVALEGVNFTIRRGMVGVVGPNGAGKTTLLRQLAGVLDPTRGAIQFGGVPMRKLQRYLARWVGYLPQDAGLPASMSAREYLTWYAALYDLPHDIRGQRVEDLLGEVGLAEKADDRIKSLSGGMRQRVAVARTLLRLPPVIIVDEPTAGLDPRERIRFRNLLSRLARDRIVLMSTHVVEDVAVACDRVLVMARGQLIFDGRIDALASAAKGCVWEMRTPPDTELQLPTGASHTEEKPAADGSIVHRILAARQPTDSARPLDATLEDGYIWLLNGAGANSLEEALA